MIFSQYSLVKDKCCICYFGPCDEYAVMLKYLRPHIEKQLQGLEIFLSFKDNALYLLEGEERIISKSNLKGKEREFGYIKTITCNMKDHPIEAIFKESNLEIPTFETETGGDLCFLVADSVVPTKSLTQEEIRKVRNKYRFVDSPQSATWIVGVESAVLFEAAFSGRKTTLIPTGLGTNFYQKLFPNGGLEKLC